MSVCGDEWHAHGQRQFLRSLDFGLLNKVDDFLCDCWSGSRLILYPPPKDIRQAAGYDDNSLWGELIDCIRRHLVPIDDQMAVHQTNSLFGMCGSPDALGEHQLIYRTQAIDKRARDDMADARLSGYQPLAQSGFPDTGYTGDKDDAVLDHDSSFISSSSAGFARRHDIGGENPLETRSLRSGIGLGSIAGALKNKALASLAPSKYV
ncbi:hypothetical protein QM467_18225 [Rhodoblastus sp. 17X3]|uniref:hypothetical protein n=1 Tax=Rhodoblastus sp. 17X3 TaxID=3047026 RepID=UPI0024B6AE94|nr:hypothetical protein [Rhodoblastus sp. 17X3]MDI9849979.1 hypothetical protein [Rhodoblastus sp. 17X3]